MIWEFLNSFVNAIGFGAAHLEVGQDWVFGQLGLGYEEVGYVGTVMEIEKCAEKRGARDEELLFDLLAQKMTL